MYFRFKHQVFPVRKPCALVVEPVAPVTVCDQNRYTMVLYPFSGLRRYGMQHQPTAEDEAFFSVQQPLNVRDGALELSVRFPQEDCYICRLFINGEEVQRMELYALEDDLFAVTPYKGDNHMHTWYSDGKDSPAYMCAAACRHGYDYCVVTDHKQYEPSLIARDFYQPTGVDFLIIPGEEVHSPDNPVHIINLGGTQSVNDWWRDQEPEYRAAVEKEMESVTVTMGDRDRYTVAACQVMFERIRSVDGVAVLCHPNWIIANGFNEHEDVTDYLFDNRRFDALELIAGGAYEDGTQMQLSYYQRQEQMPILGNSDAHACFGGKLEPGNFTIVFADALDAQSIKKAIRAGYTVAGNGNKLYGDYRLVKYGYFLLRNYYPEHDRQRFDLSGHMLRMASSNGQAKDVLEKLASPRPSILFDQARYQ